jgi:dienelactone hydrolase
VVVIAYGSDGMIDNTRGPWATMLRQYARDLAANGFTAIIPDYFLRTGPAAGSIDYQKGGAQIVVMNRDSWVSGLQDAVTHAKTLAGIDPKRVGLLGFSLGGHLGLRCARPLKCSRSFLRRCSTVSAPGSAGSRLPVQIHHGSIDPATGIGDTLVTFQANAIPIEQELKREGASPELHEYVGAGHGFVGTDAADKSASTQSKARTIAFFFKSHL